MFIGPEAAVGKFGESQIRQDDWNKEWEEGGGRQRLKILRASG